jgi:hypothetical protein
MRIKDEVVSRKAKVFDDVTKKRTVFDSLF